MSRRWIRLDAQWEESSWIDGLSGEAAGCWPRLLCWVKLRGRRGVCSAPSASVLARMWKVERSSVEAMLEAARSDGAIAIHEGQLAITHWTDYQEPDLTSTDRKRKQRAKKSESHTPVTPESRRDTVARDHRPPTTDSETERTATTTAPASPVADVEKSDGQTGRVGDRPTYTQGELMVAANERLGLGRLPYSDQATNKRILNNWLYSSAKREPMEIFCAIMGAADMRDRDLVGWDSAKPGMPMTLKALNGPVVLADQGDGRAPRLLYQAAYDHYVRMGDQGRDRRATTTTVKTNAMGHVGEIARKLAG